MKPILSWKVADDGFDFNCSADGTLVPADEWALIDVFLPYGRKATLGPILSLVEDEIATVNDGLTVTLPHSAVANLKEMEHTQLGLPDVAPYNLGIEGHGLLSDADFRFSWYFLKPDHRRLMGTERNGALLKVGSNSFILFEPFFSILEGMESFNTTPPENIEDRFLIWGGLKELLPDDIIVGDYLRSFNIVKADSFTIRPYLNQDGEPYFDPILTRTISKESETTPGQMFHEHLNVLPSAPQNSFISQFRDRPRAHKRYVLQGGWYVVVPDVLKNALQTVREVIDGSPEERQSFISNPRSLLKEKLNTDYDENSIENLFFESDEFSDRIREIGLWNPPVLPFILPAKEEWLPPEDFGLRIGETMVYVDPADVKELRDEVQQAIDQGRPSVKYKEYKIPASDQSLDALNRLVGVAHPEQPEKERKPKPDDAKKPVAFLIKGNLEELDYEFEKRASRGLLGSWPSQIISTPLQHQLTGMRWLQDHWVNGNSGALLADDMGLGKTLQAFAFMAWVREQLGKIHDHIPPMLVVAPTGLLKNWLDEHDKHLVSPGLGGGFNAYGSDLNKLRLPAASTIKEVAGGLPVLDVEQLRKREWVLTTYETLRDYQHSFGRVNWSVLVFDEAQKIKNPAVLMTSAAKAMNADFILTMTGTPVENRLSDLWCIVDTAQPGRLGSLKGFSKYYEKRFEDKPERLGELKEELTIKKRPPLMLRRMKNDYLKGLPQKHENPIRESMPPVQAKAYEETVELAKYGEPKKGKILEILHRLRSISLHPFSKGEESDDEYIMSSARLKVAFELMDRIAEKRQKVLVFTESREMQGVLSELIQRRYSLRQPLLIINGQVSGKKRKERVDDFQGRSGFEVMILSPKAGGVGLTLTAANNVIHLSRWWNPAVEDQCTDRAYRIGQDKSVNIYYPIAVHPYFQDHSFDVCLHGLLIRKRELSRTVLAPPAASETDAEDLFKETVFHDRKKKDPLDFVDIMEPEAFEEWVLGSLRRERYLVERTPKSWDCGADGLAMAPDGSGKCDLILQCKHTQSDRPCDENSVREILNAVEHYAQRSRDFQPLVVTNSSSYSEEATRLAERKGVRLMKRADILRWAVGNL